MTIRLLHILMALFMLLGTGSMAMAEDEFNPANPPEPEVLYRVSVSATPAGKGAVSGTGFYRAGEGVWINTSATDGDYAFKQWLLDGQPYSTEQGFYFTMPESNVNFVAEYEFVVFNPDSPSDPTLDYRWRLYLTAEPPEAASFNINSGSQLAPDSWNTITAYANQGFQFLGWYEGSNKIASELTFNYEMGSSDAHLVARFSFNPVSPADPESDPSQEDIDTGVKGDLNGDGTVDAMDIVKLVNHFLVDGEYVKKYDLNGDGSIDVQDVTNIVNIFLNSN